MQRLLQTREKPRRNKLRLYEIMRQNRLAIALTILLALAGCRRQSADVRPHLSEPFPENLSDWHLFTASAPTLASNKGVIPGEVLPHLFDPFRGGQRHLGRSEGLGLGLYIVQQIVLAHGGHVDVKTDAQRTTFIVQIPRRPAS